MNSRTSTTGDAEPIPFSQSQYVSGEVMGQSTEPEFNPLQALGRLMRGRWLPLLAISALVAGSGGAIGFSTGTEVYEGRTIIRISAREPSILFANSDNSRLKLFQAFVKGETTYVASHPVMARAAEIVAADPSAVGTETTAKSMTDAVGIQRNDALIVITAASTNATLAAAKANAVVEAYLALTAENELDRSNYREGELAAREAELLTKLERSNHQMLEVGGEFGSASLAKAHIAKVAQLEALLTRRAEVEATLEAMRAKTNLAGTDMGDVEIKRATLLDRGLADLTFDKAKREAELVALLRRYVDGSPKVIEKRQEIIIMDAAITARREQIGVLGRTGALTDAETSSEDETISEIEAVLAKVNTQIAEVRDDAKALNGKRLRLDFLQEEHDETRRMLDETRRALDAVRLESQNAMPGLIEVLTPAIVPDAPIKNKRKVFGAVGFAGGGLVAMALFLFIAARRGLVRYSDDLWRLTPRMPLLSVMPRQRRLDGPDRDVDQLCNTIQLLPDHGVGRFRTTRIIAVGGADGADSADLAHALGDSFTRRAIPTLLLDADLVSGSLTKSLGLQDAQGWREMLSGRAPMVQVDPSGMTVRGAGVYESVLDDNVSAQMVRDALSAAGQEFDVIVLNLGGLCGSLSATLVAASADLVIGVVQPGDRLDEVDRSLRRVDELSRMGAAIVFYDAAQVDPSKHS